jgi:hypothetical protein
MKVAFCLTVSLAALAATAHPAGATHTGGKCVMAGGQATMVTQDLAKFMAGAALKNSMAAHGWKPHGAVKMKCDTEAGLPHCVAKQKACG